MSTGADISASQNVPRWSSDLGVRLVWAKSHEYEPGESVETFDIPVYALWLVTRGTIEVRFDGREFSVSAGQAFLGVPYRRRCICTPEGAAWLSAGLNITAPDGFEMLSALDPGPFDLSNEGRQEVGNLLQLLVDASYWPGEGGSLARDGIARALAGWLLRTREAPEHFSSLPGWLRDVLERVEQQPDVTVEALAKAAHFSPAQFRRLFIRHVGASPRDYLQRRRMELAQRLLETTELSITEVAERSGFGGGAQFSRDFKRHAQMPPLQWRRLVRESI